MVKVEINDTQGLGSPLVLEHVQRDNLTETLRSTAQVSSMVYGDAGRNGRRCG